MKEIEYNREKSCEYAKQWAFKRNPQYYNYDAIGGDCTNFISQCIFAGSQVMNYEKIKGWYYNNANNKAPAWTGVEFLYNFITNNKSVGPYGKEVSEKEVEIGDIAQISFDRNIFAHTAIIVKIDEAKQIYVAAHTFDCYEKKISEYISEKIRYIHIEGVRKY